MAKNETSFKKGNKAAVKSPKIVIRKFAEMLKNAQSDDDILCFYDACMSISWRHTKVDYWVKKLPVFDTFKKEIQNAIVSRINKKALKGEFNPTASIWRFKQLGERDEKVIDNKSSDGSMTPKATDLSKASSETLKKLRDEVE